MEKVVTKKSFIGGRLVYPGETVDVDAKGEIAPAASTPIGMLTVEQLRAALSARETEGQRAEDFGKNLADRTPTNTGSQALEIAPVAPASPTATMPQGLPPGSVPHRGGFIHPASTDAPAAVEEVVAAGAGDVVQEQSGSDAFNPDAIIDGKSDDVIGRLANLDVDQLRLAHAAEQDREQPRKGVSAAIEAEIAKRSDA